MTALIEQEQFSSAIKVSNDPFHFDQKRGALLDAFIELEIAMARWLRFLSGSEHSNLLLGQRIDKLAKHEKLDELAGKNQVRIIRSIPVTCLKSLEIRNSIAHGQRTFGTREGVACVFVQSVPDILSETPRYMVLSQQEIIDAQVQISRLANQLRGWLVQINPPSSPPPPSLA